MTYTKPSWSRTSFVLLLKLGDRAHLGPHQGLAPDLTDPSLSHHVWHVPQGVPHAWRGSDSSLESDCIMDWVQYEDPT